MDTSLLKMKFHAVLLLLGVVGMIQFLVLLSYLSKGNLCGIASGGVPEWFNSAGYAQPSSDIDLASREIGPLLKTGETSITNQSYYTILETTPKVTGNRTFLNLKGVFLRAKGGIGNQLYQYACHYALARKHNAPLYIKLSNSERSQLGQKRKRNLAVDDRSFVLDAFNVPLFSWNTIDDTWILPKTLNATDSDILLGIYNSTRFQNSLVTGKDYCLSASYFAPYQYELWDLFTLKVDDVLTEAAKSWEKFIIEEGNIRETVAVHIRRGDFVNFATPLTFYVTAMSRMRQELMRRNNKHVLISLFIFSDDVTYVRDEFLTILNGTEGTINVHIVSDPTKLTSLEEFYLASKCKNFIIPNSTFGWWVAYLSEYPDKIVYAAHVTTEHVRWLYREANINVQSFYLWQYNRIYYPSGWNGIYPVP
ncbi:O-antigen biosynthesis glycosyltransferase WbnK-like [Folsomia candida]|uniref:O-antigen biosynthesis glycosyltransferase WbnK-like n=1 Tax=Folsomia candida TaxID=158441 RepID=UPI00160532A4|nr:O-antigen biosynthesis glycosyltransferase WbnK-like [Folsomia candida]